MRAVIAGAGFGGLAAAAGLRQRGWDVTVVERAAELHPVGAGLAVAVNGQRALDTLGVGDRVRALAAFHGDALVRRPDGRLLARTDSAAMVRRFGGPVVPATRAAVLDLLLGLLPADAVWLGVTVTGVDAERGRLSTDAGELEADLVVAADGVNSVLRRAVFPAHPGPVYSGFTAWRMLVAAPRVPFLPGETWGGGKVFGITPLADGRVYAYAADRAAAGEMFEDERAELLRRFGGWHAPIPELIGAATSEGVLHNDIYEMATPLPAYHHGRVAVLGDAAHAMTPHLGQGANLAFEDAVTLAAVVGGAATTDEVPLCLASYTEQRLPRGTDIVRRSHRLGELTQATSRPKVAVRNAGIRVAGKLFPDLTLRAMDPVVGWQAP